MQEKISKIYEAFNQGDSFPVVSVDITCSCHTDLHYNVHLRIKLQNSNKIYRDLYSSERGNNLLLAFNGAIQEMISRLKDQLSPSQIDNLTGHQVKFIETVLPELENILKE